MSHRPDPVSGSQASSSTYAGIFGLDRAPRWAKEINFVITVSGAPVILLLVWSTAEIGDYNIPSFNLPTLLWFSYPANLILLWMRLSGLRWRAILAASLLIALLYSSIALFLTIARGIVIN